MTGQPEREALPQVERPIKLMRPPWRRVGFMFEPRDLWVGVFVGKEVYDESSGDWVQRTYICLVPMLVLVISRWKSGW